jgi:hypothetical protein
VVLIDLAGQALAEMGETFAAALVEAGDDPALRAPVRLRQTWAAMVGGRPDAGTRSRRPAAPAPTAPTSPSRTPARR